MKFSDNKKLNLSHPITVVLMAVIACLLWGNAFPCVKIGYDLFSVDTGKVGNVILFAGLRFTLAGILVIIFGSLIQRKFLRPKSLKTVRRIGIVSVFQTTLQYLFFYIGLSNTTGVKASVIDATNVFLSIFIAVYIFRQDKMTWKKLLGCLLGFAGVVLVNFEGLSFDFNFLGDGFVFLSAVCYGFSSSFIKKYSAEEDVFTVSGYQFFIGGITLIVVGLLFGGRITVFSFEAGLMLFYLGIISSVAYTIWSLLLKYNPPSKVAIFGFLTSTFGVVLSAVILREPIVWYFYVPSLLLIAFGIVTIHAPKKYKKTLDNDTKV